MKYIYFVLTENCNLLCSHCIRGDKKRDYVDYTQAIDVLSMLSSWYPKAGLILTGGEPTLHPDFSKILTDALSKFNHIALCSNGTTPFFKDYISLLNKPKLKIQFSLDGDKEYHNVIRGANSFERTVNNINTLNNNGIPVYISTVVSRKNKDSIFQLADTLSSCKIEKWNVNNIMPFGNADVSDMLSTKEWNVFVDELISITPFRLGIKKEFDFQLLNRLSDDEINNISHYNSANNISLHCGSIDSKVYIYPNLDVYGCTCLKEHCLGNLKYNSLPEILNSSNCQSLKKSLSVKNPLCKNCRFLPLCGGGCYGMIYRFGYDIRCPLLNNEKDE